MQITDKQAQYFEIESYERLSPKMTKNALRICANESYQKAEEELLSLTGIKISHSTLNRLVNRQDIELPESKVGVQEITLDGGKIRLRTEEQGKPGEWKDYKATCINGIYYGAFFQDNQGLIDWLNSQKLLAPLFCLGDGHPGIWNLFQEIGEGQQRQEILDWYHLKENLYKVKTTSVQLQKMESLLWLGKVSAVLKILKTLHTSEAVNFHKYLKKHRARIINYEFYHREQISSIGSGAIESGIKQAVEGC